MSGARASKGRLDAQRAAASKAKRAVERSGEAARRESELSHKLMQALESGAPEEELDALFEQGARAGWNETRSAALGGVASARWALSHARVAGPGGLSGQRRLEALWMGLALARQTETLEVFIEELGLPRELGQGERIGACRALSSAAKRSNEALLTLLNAIDPTGLSALREGEDHYAAVAALAGAERVRALKTHPIHGPALTPELKAQAIKAVLERGPRKARV